jgi:hypothetical protein
MFSLYQHTQKHFMYAIISAASFKVVEMLQSWHSRSSLIFYHSFHTEQYTHCGMNDRISPSFENASCATLKVAAECYVIQEMFPYMLKGRKHFE